MYLSNCVLIMYYYYRGMSYVSRVYPLGTYHIHLVPRSRRGADMIELELVWMLLATWQRG